MRQTAKGKHPHGLTINWSQVLEDGSLYNMTQTQEDQHQKVIRTDKELHDISVALELQSASAIAEQNLTSAEKDVMGIIT